MTTTLVGADRAELEARAGALLARRGQDGDPAAFLKEAGPERLYGTTDQVLERLAAFAGAGVKRVMMQHLVHEDLDSLALVGEAVIPEAAKL
jgi:hypothetical protein